MRLARLRLSLSPIVNVHVHDFDSCEILHTSSKLFHSLSLLAVLSIHSNACACVPHVQFTIEFDSGNALSFMQAGAFKVQNEEVDEK